MLEYISAPEAAKKWGISERRVQKLCEENRIPGVAIGLLSEFWNQGIGTRMFQEMIKIAENNPKILQMELDFIEGNSRARALYEKMGFRITGINFNAIRQKDGTLCNEYSMIREINR